MLWEEGRAGHRQALAMRQGLRVKVATGTPPASTASPEPTGGLWMPSWPHPLSSTSTPAVHLPQASAPQRVSAPCGLLLRPTSPRGPPLCPDSGPHLAWGSLGPQFPRPSGLSPLVGQEGKLPPPPVLQRSLPVCCPGSRPGGHRSTRGKTSPAHGAPSPLLQGGVGGGCGLRGHPV